MILQWKSQWPYLADCVQGGIWVMIIHTPSKLPHSTCLISVSPSESVTFQLVCWADSVVNMTSYKTKDAFSKLNTIIHDLVDHCAFCVYWLILAFQVARVPQLLRLTWKRFDSTFMSSQYCFKANTTLISCEMFVGRGWSCWSAQETWGILYVYQTKQWHQPLDWSTGDGPPGYRFPKIHKTLSAYSCTITVT